VNGVKVAQMFTEWCILVVFLRWAFHSKSVNIEVIDIRANFVETSNMHSLNKYKIYIKFAMF
jgi:hypothetical protein